MSHYEKFMHGDFGYVVGEQPLEPFDVKKENVNRLPVWGNLTSKFTSDFQYVSEEKDEAQSLITERESRYGSFAHNSDISQKLKHIARQGDSWHKLEAHQKECLEMVLHKISRIVCGDVEYLDSFEDIAGYATRCAQIMKEKNGE